MDYEVVGPLFMHFVLLSLMSVGGIGSVIPDMHRYVVEEQHWISARQFADDYALGQAAPGPNMMYVTLIGWQIAGFAGALATTAAMIFPPATLTLVVVRWNALAPDTRLGRVIRSGFAPITLGLLLATGWLIVSTVNDSWPAYLLTVATIAVVLRTKWNPVWLIGVGALAGIAGIV
jgi:chromate transporter